MNKIKIERGQTKVQQQQNVRSRALKVWNGRGHGKYQRNHIYVAAYSKKQAAEIVGIACKTHVPVNEITIYYNACWGNSMNDVIPTEPCVYIVENFGKEKPVRVY